MQLLVLEHSLLEQTGLDSQEGTEAESSGVDQTEHLDLESLGSAVFLPPLPQVLSGSSHVLVSECISLGHHLLQVLNSEPLIDSSSEDLSVLSGHLLPVLLVPPNSQNSSHSSPHSSPPEEGKSDSVLTEEPSEDLVSPDLALMASL
eukprot:TRINITY_DN1923_c0_g2_i1.p2 TRINITY_DN1923_c0_g2~~TRINITY_DN1923_c0_g2_i1.p2  ORF type:complete len:147 (+),score=36.76 TRINITY_DN1923_c0_g2_i1:375-815(+)